MEIVWTVAIIGWLICGIAGAALLSRYEKAGTGFILGFLLGPIGWIIAWTMRDSQKHKELLQAAGVSPSSAQQQGHRKERNCPFCAELILIEAKICRHCRSEVEPEQIPLDSFKELGAKFTNDEEGTATYLNFSNRDITDANLISLKERIDLKILDISNTPITDAGLKHLKGLANLQKLALMGCRKITNAGLVHIKGLPKLQKLDLRYTKFTDAGLTHIKGLTNLQFLNLYGCENITATGLSNLRQSLPKCVITGPMRTVQHKSEQGIMNVAEKLEVKAIRSEVVEGRDSASSSAEATIHQIKCRCGAKLSVKRSLSGKTAKCPKCGHRFTIP